MTLQAVHIKNYQSLEDVCIALEGFTCIVGESDCGKSAFIRAVQGLTNNESGKSFVTYGQRDCQVKAVLVDEPVSTVIWTKGYENCYSIDGNLYDRVGSSCPEEVFSVLRVGELSVGNDIKFAPNFHGQFDIPFLMGRSGGQIAKILGEITNINILFDAARLAKKEMNDQRKVLVIRKEDFISVKSSIETFSDLPELDIMLTKLERVVVVLDRNFDLVLRMDTHCMRLAEAREKQEHHRVACCYAKEESEILAAVVEYKDLFPRLQGMQECWNKSVFLRGAISAHELDVSIARKEIDALADLPEASEFVLLQNMQIWLGTLAAHRATVDRHEARVNSVRNLNEALVDLPDEKEFVQLTEHCLLLDRLRTASAVLEIKVDAKLKSEADVEQAEWQVELFKKEHPNCPTCGKAW